MVKTAMRNHGTSTQHRGLWARIVRTFRRTPSSNARGQKTALKKDTTAYITFFRDVDEMEEYVKSLHS